MPTSSASSVAGTLSHALVPALEALFRYVVAERMGVIILSAIVAHTGWHWMMDRGARLFQFNFEWPAFDAVFWVAVMRWAMIAVAVLGLYWLVFGVLRVGRPVQHPASSQASS